MRRVDVFHRAVLPLLLLVSPNTASTAFVIPSSTSCRRSCQQQQQQSHYSSTLKPQCMIFQRFINQFSKQKHSPSEEDDNTSASYDDLLREASKSPEAFEIFVENSMMISSSNSNSDNNLEGKNSSGNNNIDIASSSEANANRHEIDEDGNDNISTKYVSIEEWEAQRKNGENMTAEERLQWECQRNGDQFRQNDILTHNLKRLL